MTLVAAALMAAAAPASAQLQVTSNNVTPSNGQPANVTVSSSTGTPISYRVGLTYGTAQAGWYKVQDGAFNTLNNGSVENTGTAPGTTPGGMLVISLQLTPLQTVSGTITLTDTATATDTVSITVNYVPGGGTGGGTLTASVSSVNLSTNPNNSQQVNSNLITLTTTSAAQISGNIALVNSNTAYLSLSNSTFAVSSGFQFSFYLIGAAFTPAGTYSASIQITPTNGNNANNITIPVTYTSGSGTSANPNNFTLVYPNGTQTVQVTTPAQFYYASTNYPWLLVNGASITSNMSPGTTFQVSLNASVAASTANGTQGIVNVFASDGSQASITVTLQQSGSSSGVTASPSSVTFNVPAGTFNQQASNVNLTTPFSNVTYNLSWFTNSGGQWLSVSPTFGTLTGGNQNNTITVFASPSGLAQGTYTGTISITYGNGFSGSTQIPVTMNVGSGSGGGTGGLVAPASLTFYYQIAAVGPGNLGLSSAILVNTSGSWTTTTTYNSSQQNWLSVSQSGPGSQNIFVNVSPTGLQAGTYTANINVTSSGGSATVPVSLQVTNSMVAAVNPATILINNFTLGSGNPQPSNVSVYTSDNSQQTVTATPSASWITATCPNTTTVATCLIQINPSGLPNGLNSGTVTFTVTNATNTSVVLPVAIVINGSTNNGGPLNFSQSSLAFNTAVGGSAPSQSLTVSSNSASTFSVTATSSGWLSVIPANTLLSLPQTITVSVNPAGLSANTYTGTLNFQAGGVTQSLQVIMNVGTNGGSLSANPSNMSFAYQVGGSTPSAQTLGVSSTSGNVGFTVSVSTTTGGSWLSVNAASATTPANLSVTVNPSGLGAGTYNGTITLISSVGTATVSVSLTVISNTSVSATPTTLSFSYSAGGATPSSQVVTINGSGTFSATATSTGNWLAVTPNSGTAPSTVTASVNPAGLTAGTYNGSISVVGTGTSTGSTTVSVTLVVTAPLPTITSVSNAASYATGSIAPGEIITIIGTALGPTTPLQLTLTSAGTVSTTLGNVQVLVNGIPAPLIYVSSTQVSAVVPYEIAIFQTAQVFVNFLGQTSNAVQELVSTTQPGLFTANSSGTGPGAILNQNFSVNSPSNPAAKGSVVTLYLTGEGQTSPKGVTGSVTQAQTTPPITPAPLLPVGVTINGSPVAIQFVGEAPQIVAGVLQINVTIPSNAPSGNLQVIVTIGANNSQSGVTVSVQ